MNKILNKEENKMKELLMFCNRNSVLGKPGHHPVHPTDVPAAGASKHVSQTISPAIFRGNIQNE